MNQCDLCDSKPTCFDEPREDCPDFRPNDKYLRNRIEEQVKEHDERVIRKFVKWLCENYTVMDNNNEVADADDLFWEYD